MSEKQTDPQEDTSQDNNHETMTFLEHLEELRQRLIKCIIAVVVGIFVCWFFREELRQFIEAPLYTAWKSVPGLPAPSPLSFKSLMEPFVAYLKIAAIGGVFFASPVIFYHLWRFISPGLYNKEKRFALPFVFISSALFMVGSAGAYAYVFPIGFSFFLQFSSGGNVETLQSDPVALIAKTTKKEKIEKAPEKAASQIKKPTAAAPKIALTTDEPAVPAPVAAPLDATATEEEPNEATPVADATPPSDPPKAEVAKEKTVGKSPKTEEPKTTVSTNKAASDKKTATPKAVPPRTLDGKSGKPTPNNTSKWTQVRKWYRWVENKLLGENCGELKTFPSQKNVRLEYRFDTKRCGEKPTSILVKKDQHSINFKMDSAAENNDIVTFSGIDHTATLNPATYQLTVVHAAAQKLAPVLMVKDYLDFAVKLLLAFGLVFELPVLIFFLAFAGIVNYKQLISFGRWFVVLSVTFAAFLTPPDVVTQIMLATPLVILYYLSILVVFLLDKKRTIGE